MTQDGVTKDDVKVPEGEIGQQISQEFEDGKELLVTIVASMGEEQVRIYLLSAMFSAIKGCFVGHLFQGGSQRLLIVYVGSILL